jgi:hypothetical protein
MPFAANLLVFKGFNTSQKWQEQGSYVCIKASVCLPGLPVFFCLQVIN